MTNETRYDYLCWLMESWSDSPSWEGQVLHALSVASEDGYDAVYASRTMKNESHEEDTKYCSVEVSSLGREDMQWPRDSVEPVHHSNGFRVTDELRYGELRRTDEIIFDQGHHRGTDSPLIKQEPD